MTTFYWDFFGPNSQPTAEHFLVHLDQFLVQNGCVGCTTGFASEGAGQATVWCRSAPEHATAIERTLRPKRSEPSP